MAWCEDTSQVNGNHSYHTWTFCCRLDLLLIRKELLRGLVISIITHARMKITRSLPRIPYNIKTFDGLPTCWRSLNAKFVAMSSSGTPWSCTQNSTKLMHHFFYLTHLSNTIRLPPTGQGPSLITFARSNTCWKWNKKVSFWKFFIVTGRCAFHPLTRPSVAAWAL